MSAGAPRSVKFRLILFGGALLALVLVGMGGLRLFLPRGEAPAVGEVSTAAANLARFHEGLLERYPRTDHISAAALSDLPADQVLLFDVRETDEFEVSHLEGAIRVDPNISARRFLRLHGDELEGKTLIFYCSVGERSSSLAQAVGDATEGLAIANLEDGIFKWHNEFRPVFAGGLETDTVHPFNDFWGQLLER